MTFMIYVTILLHLSNYCSFQGVNNGNKIEATVNMVNNDELMQSGIPQLILSNTYGMNSLNKYNEVD